jgi:hypothetical protein
VLLEVGEEAGVGGGGCGGGRPGFLKVIRRCCPTNCQWIRDSSVGEKHVIDIASSARGILGLGVVKVLTLGACVLEVGGGLCRKVQILEVRRRAICGILWRGRGEEVFFAPAAMPDYFQDQRPSVRAGWARRLMAGD